MTRPAPYEHWIAWIVRHRSDSGPLRLGRTGDVVRVSVWKTVRMVADNFQRPAKQVAADVIAFADLHEHGAPQP